MDTYKRKWLGGEHWYKKNDGLSSKGLIDKIRNGRKPNCLTGLTFVFTGEIESSLSREEAEDLVRDLGGFIQGAVSGRRITLSLEGS